MAFVPDQLPEPPPAIVASMLHEDNTDRDVAEDEDPMTDELFDFDAPMPPQADSITGQPTANYGYEFQVGIWRDRMTRGLKAVHNEQKRYQRDEDRRHKEVMGYLRGQDSWAVSFIDAVKGCGTGTMEIVVTATGNENGQLKYVALVLLGLAAIVQGVAFSFMGFEAGDATRCGPGTVEDSGFCLPTD